MGATRDSQLIPPALSALPSVCPPIRPAVRPPRPSAPPRPPARPSARRGNLFIHPPTSRSPAPDAATSIYTKKIVGYSKSADFLNQRHTNISKSWNKSVQI